MSANPIEHASAAKPVDNHGASREARDEPWLQPWQFFLLGGMLAATATVIVATGQSPANIIILSLTVVSVSFVGLGAYHVLLPLVSDEVRPPATIGGRTRAALEREKTLVLRSIKELEFDYAMGKVAKADFDEMSTRLRARAARLIRQLDAGGGYREQIAREVEVRLGAVAGATDAVAGATSEAGAAGATGAPGDASGADLSGRSSLDGARAEADACAACGTSNDEDAKFCKNCGVRL